VEDDNERVGGSGGALEAGSVLVREPDPDRPRKRWEGEHGPGPLVDSPLPAPAPAPGPAPESGAPADVDEAGGHVHEAKTETPDPRTLDTDTYSEDAKRSVPRDKMRGSGEAADEWKRRRATFTNHYIPIRTIAGVYGSDRIDLELTPEVYAAAQWAGGIYMEDIHDSVSCIIMPMHKMYPPNHRYSTLTWKNLCGDVRGGRFGITLIKSKAEAAKSAVAKPPPSASRRRAKRAVGGASGAGAGAGTGEGTGTARDKAKPKEDPHPANVHSMADGQAYVPLTQEAQSAILEWLASDEQTRRSHLSDRKDLDDGFGRDDIPEIGRFPGSSVADVSGTGLEGSWNYLGLRFLPGEVHAIIADFELEAPALITETGFEALAASYQDQLRPFFRGRFAERLHVAVSVPYYTVVRRESKDSAGRTVYRQLVKNAAHIIFPLLPCDMIRHFMCLRLFDDAISDLWGNDHPFESQKPVENINDKSVLGNGIRFNFAGKAILCPYQSKEDSNHCRQRNCARCGGEGKLHVDRRYELCIFLNPDGSPNSAVVARARKDLLFQLQLTSPFMIEGVEICAGLFRENRLTEDWVWPFPREIVALVEGQEGEIARSVEWKKWQHIPVGKEVEWVKSAASAAREASLGASISSGAGVLEPRTRYSHQASGSGERLWTLCQRAPAYGVGFMSGGKRMFAGGAREQREVVLSFAWRNRIQDLLRSFLRDPARGSKPVLGRVYRMVSRSRGSASGSSSSSFSSATGAVASMGAGAGGGAGGGAVAVPVVGSGAASGTAHHSRPSSGYEFVVMQIRRKFNYCLNKGGCHTGSSIYVVVRYRARMPLHSKSKSDHQTEWYQKCHSPHVYSQDPCDQWASDVLFRSADPDLIRILFPESSASALVPGSVFSATLPGPAGAPISDPTTTTTTIIGPRRGSVSGSSFVLGSRIPSPGPSPAQPPPQPPPRTPATATATSTAPSSSLAPVSIPLLGMGPRSASPYLALSLARGSPVPGRATASPSRSTTASPSPSTFSPFSFARDIPSPGPAPGSSSRSGPRGSPTLASEWTGSVSLGLGRSHSAYPRTPPPSPSSARSPAPASAATVAVSSGGRSLPLGASESPGTVSTDQSLVVRLSGVATHAPTVHCRIADPHVGLKRTTSSLRFPGAAHAVKPPTVSTLSARSGSVPGSRAGAGSGSGAGSRSGVVAGGVGGGGGPRAGDGVPTSPRPGRSAASSPFANGFGAAGVFRDPGQRLWTPPASPHPRTGPAPRVAAF
jgi:hypothetical protein